MIDIREELANRILFFDGGMGTLLQERGLGIGELPETWNLTRPDEIVAIHAAYLNAGADIISANTFGANRLKFGDNVTEIVSSGVKNAKKAVMQSGKKAYVALDIGSVGKLLKPLGTLDFEDAVSIFSEVIAVGAEAGADLVLIETMSDAYELKAAVLAAKETCDLPIFATAIFDEKHKMLTGADVKGLVALLEGLSVDALGLNCGLGPAQMLEIAKEMLRYASIPVIVNPNAGMPRTENGKTVFDVAPQEFAAQMQEIAQMGALVLGGCCGTTPAHIEELVSVCGKIPAKPLTEKTFSLVSSGSQTVELGSRPVIIGERINPTGKARFKQALRDGDMQYILQEGAMQADSGAHILDVNVGLPEIDETLVMEKTVLALQEILPLPLQIDTTSPSAMERALRLYNGKAMVNSVNGKKEVLDSILPIVKKYGGVVVGLTIGEDGIPETAEGRVKIAEQIYAAAAQYGIAKKDIVIDPLTMSLSTDTNSANITLDAVRRIHEMGGQTVLGVSNISFGLPQRKLMNTTFFTMALSAGLSAGIINPNIPEMMQAYDSFVTLSGKDAQCSTYIEKYAPTQNEAPKAPTGQTEYTLEQCIVKGLREKAYSQTEALLQTRDPMDIINNELVSALNIVGEGFEKGTMFLPQLLQSASAAQSGFEAIKKHMQKSGKKQQSKATVILATVKGDIHDIGKNIVKVLLENYGYEVIDLGKDVAPELVVETLRQTKAPVVGLSALMTTTVSNMQETIRQIKEANLPCKVMVGGAVLTYEYAMQIGADFYGKDAMQSVRYVEELFCSEN